MSRASGTTSKKTCRACGSARDAHPRCPNCGRRPSTRVELIAATAIFICVGVPCLLIGPPLWLAANESAEVLIGFLSVGGGLFWLMAATLKHTE